MYPYLCIPTYCHCLYFYISIMTTVLSHIIIPRSHIISHHFQRITSEILRILHLTYQGAFMIPITFHTIFIDYMLGLKWILHMICIPYELHVSHSLHLHTILHLHMTMVSIPYHYPLVN